MTGSPVGWGVVAGGQGALLVLWRALTSPRAVPRGEATRGAGEWLADQRVGNERARQGCSRGRVGVDLQAQAREHPWRALRLEAP